MDATRGRPDNMADDINTGIKKLNDDNYHVWQLQMRSLLDVKGLSSTLVNDTAAGSAKARGLIILCECF